MKVSVFCAIGMSTSVVVKKIKKEADAEGIELDIAAHSVNDIETYAPGSDMILIGPQIAYRKAEIQTMFPGIPVEAMPMRDYGTGNGKNILKLILNNVKK